MFFRLSTMRSGRCLFGRSRKMKLERHRFRDPRRAKPRVEPLESRMLLAAAPEVASPDLADQLEDGSQVIRTMAYHQITSFDNSVIAATYGQPVLSDNGNRAVFTREPSGTGNPDFPNRIFVINPDGTGLTEVDSYRSRCFCLSQSDITADGSRVVSTEEMQLRIANADGTGRKELIALNSNDLHDLRISGDGSRVFFIVRRDTTRAGTNERVERGLYAINPDGSGLIQLVGPTHVARHFGVSPASVFPFEAGSEKSLEISSDGSRIVFATWVDGVGSRLFRVNGNGTGLATFDFGDIPYNGLWNLGISGDGSTVFYYIHGAGGTTELGVMDYSGTERRVLSNDRLSGSGSSAMLFQLTEDGSQLLFGDSSRLINTDGSGEVQLAVGDGIWGRDLLTGGMYGVTMDITASRFLYVMRQDTLYQLATMEMNPTDLRLAPGVTEVMVDPGYVLTNGDSVATVRARVNTPNTIQRVEETILLDGRPSIPHFRTESLSDMDSSIDEMTGDGVYTRTNVGPREPGAEVGPRTIRVNAEVIGGDGLRHATAVEIGGFEVLREPPTGSSIQLDLQPGSDTGSSNSDNVTNDMTPTIDVTINQTGRIGIDFDADGIPDVEQDKMRGTHAFTSPALSDGSHQVRAWLTLPERTRAAESTLQFIIDTQAPSLQVPEDMIVQADGPNGKRVDYTMPTAQDSFDADPSIECSPVSGSTFPVGQTMVSCTAADDAGNHQTDSFQVTVNERAAGDDIYEENDSMSQAYDLGTLRSVRTLTQLQMRDGSDWFKFQSAEGGSRSLSVSVDSQFNEGDLDLYLYNAQGQVIGSSASDGNDESISLNDLSSGSYFVEVYGYDDLQTSDYSLTIDPSSSQPATDDTYEENDSMDQAYDLGLLSSSQTITQLQMRDWEDWFKFQIAEGGSRALSVSVGSQLNEGDLDLYLYNAQGQMIGDSAMEGNNESIALTDIAPGSYFVEVYGYDGQQTSDYSLAIDPGMAPRPPGDDIYEENDNLSQAHDLGALSSTRTVTQLQMRDGEDWFEFQLAEGDSRSLSLSISSQLSEGDLDLFLYSAEGQLIGRSENWDNSESISLKNLASGRYFVRVHGYDGQETSNYSLTIDPGGDPRPNGRVLYLNFDGANISRSDLVRWSADWGGDIFGLDPEGDGITVQPYQDAARDQLIERILELVQEDIRPFEIQVQRHTGLAVEGVGATTIFVGASSLPRDTPHIAGIVDFGNDNATDIAFVGQENWGTVERTALALADVVLHEAGHTWGLCHVNSASNPETMGLRYSIPDQSQWVANTRFMDQTFPEFVDNDGSTHCGGRGPQNSYQTMVQHFGTTQGSNPVFSDESQHQGLGGDHLARGTAAVFLGADKLVVPEFHVFHAEGTDISNASPTVSSDAGLASVDAIRREPQLNSFAVWQMESADSLRRSDLDMARFHEDHAQSVDELFADLNLDPLGDLVDGYKSRGASAKG